VITSAYFQRCPAPGDQDARSPGGGFSVERISSMNPAAALAYGFRSQVRDGWVFDLAGGT